MMAKEEPKLTAYAVWECSKVFLDVPSGMGIPYEDGSLHIDLTPEQAFNLGQQLINAAWEHLKLDLAYTAYTQDKLQAKTGASTEEGKMKTASEILHSELADLDIKDRRRIERLLAWERLMLHLSSFFYRWWPPYTYRVDRECEEEKTNV
jgi:hypothetical protein